MSKPVPFDLLDPKLQRKVAAAADAAITSVAGWPWDPTAQRMYAACCDAITNVINQIGAPDLLAACKLALSAGDWDERCCPRTTIEALKAAIAKTEGSDNEGEQR